MNAGAIKAKAAADRRMKIRIAGYAAILIGVVFVGVIVRDILTWEPKPAPYDGWYSCGEKPPYGRMEVITEAYMDLEGKWRSFDNGHVITVKQWREKTKN
jgi:hypothetical protein